MRFFLLLLLLSSQPLIAQIDSLTDKPLQADQAFLLKVRKESPLTYSFTWDIAEGYYLYKDKISFHSPQGRDITPQLSSNHQRHSDQFFGIQDIYYYYAYAQITLTEKQEAQQTIEVSYQGCWDQGLCYPIQQQWIGLAESPQLIAEEQVPAGKYDFYLGTLNSAGIPLVLFLFFLAGLGLTFTPCVLPMLPIISGTLTTGRNSLRQKASLASTYVLSMAFAYSLLGLMSGWLGYRLQSLLGSPPLLIVLALLISLFALSMLGVVQLRLPAGLRQLAHKQLNLTTGSYKGAMLWGVLSPLIVGTCLSAPLAAALLYLAERGNPLLGAAALFLLAMGMGVPLLLFVIGLGRVLPASGPWLEKAKSFFSFILILLALFILSPLLPDTLLIFLAAMTVVIMVLYTFTRLRLTSILLAALSVAIIAYIASNLVQLDEPQFQTVDDLNRLRLKEQQAEREGRSLIIYYYADWCISCRELEWFVFKDKEIINALNQLHLVKADVTRSGSSSLSLLEHHDVLGPPSFIFIDGEGLVRKELTLIGNFKRNELLARLILLTES